MSDDNKGVRGPSSLRIMGKKVSELPLGLGEVAKQQIPGFIEQERKNRVDAIIARYPRVTMEYLDSKVLEINQNMERIAKARQGTIEDMDKYQGLIRNNKGREWDEVEVEVGELVAAYVDEHGANVDLVNPETKLPIPGTLPFQQMREQIKTLNAQRKPYADDNALWKQVNLFRDNLGRYDEVSKTEAESLLDVRQAMMLIQQRDREISKAMSEPIAVE